MNRKGIEVIGGQYFDWSESVTPSDTGQAVQGCVGLMVNVAGDVKVTYTEKDSASVDISDILFFTAGVPIYAAFSRVWSTGTAAIQIKALYRRTQSIKPA